MATRQQTRFVILSLLMLAGFTGLLFAQDAAPESALTGVESLETAAVADDASPVDKITELAVFPGEVSLTTSRDRQSLVVQARLADGRTQDVTSDAEVTFEMPGLAKFEGGTLYPVADGSTQLKVEHGGHRVIVPITVEAATVERPVSFELDVMPVLMKSGCNMGSCHGAARGKDGFRLSLFGFDPQGDYFRLTREISGRRINLARPEESLLLQKATGAVPHSGGKRFEVSSELYDTLHRWLVSGASVDAGEVPKVMSVEINPPNAVLAGEGAQQRLTVRAHYSDGTNRDVTSLAYFSTNNDNSAPVSGDGVITAATRGEAFVTARFETHTVGMDVIVLPVEQDFAWSEPPEFNYIDTLINNKLKKLRINPSQVCSDEEFLRRVYLDIIGQLPTPDEFDRFMQSKDSQKRVLLIDELLARKEFVEVWVMKWAELLQIRTTQQVTYKPMLLYYSWLQEQIANNQPIDQMVQELLSATGGTFTSPATNYYQSETDTLKISENVAQVFMGMRIQCAQCHNHPFDRWTMDDYYGFAAFFSQIGRKRAEDPREIIVFNRGGGEVNHPVGNRRMAPKFLGGETPNVKGKDRRAVLATWLASDDNPYFARNLSNIVWAHFFGRGIINEVDDVRVSNPAVNPELLDELARRFSDYRYDFRQMVRDICNSRTYQLSTATNETNIADNTNFSHGSLRRLRAEVLLDCISQVTETPNKFRGLPRGASAIQIADGNTSTYFLTTFGRAKRETVCSCEVKMEPNLSQALHLLNGDSVHNRIRQGKLIKRRLDEGVSPKDLIRELYIRCLTREPTEAETTNLRAILAEEKSQRQSLEDVFWALLNSREFLFNH
ncbi:MAG: DUF1549 domain-containing protein [Pirellulales bacterium]|nr:DUF1549 domain-containing protein [Pirellulales bacterium]